MEMNTTDHFLRGGNMIGFPITDVFMDRDGPEIILTLAGVKRIRIADDGQNCCERRYMSTDDDVQSLVGHTLTRIEIKDGPDIDDAGQSHETQFLEIGTDVGFITIVSHNEHNGYYGGFRLNIKELE